MFTRLDHADEQTIEYPRMLGDRLVEGFTTLHAHGDVADDRAKIALPFGIALFVQSGQCLNQRNAGLNHRRELAGKQHQIGFFDVAAIFLFSAGLGFFLERQDHEPAAHETGNSVIFVNGVLHAGYDPAGGVTSLVGEGNHTMVTMINIAPRVPPLPNQL